MGEENLQELGIGWPYPLRTTAPAILLDLSFHLLAFSRYSKDLVGQTSNISRLNDNQSPGIFLGGYEYLVIL